MALQVADVYGFNAKTCTWTLHVVARGRDNIYFHARSCMSGGSRCRINNSVAFNTDDLYRIIDLEENINVV